MTSRRRALFIRAAAAVLLATSVAWAQQPDREADAGRLFREGQKLLEERRYGEACPKFEAAYKKDGQLGTLINLAFCHKEQGAIWYAWLEFRDAEIKAMELGRLDRREFARQRLTELEKTPSLTKVIVDNPHKFPIAEVLVEERKVPEAERGAVFAVEPGQRKFVFRAKGKKQATTLVIVSKADKAQHVLVPEMEAAPAPDPSPPPPPPDKRDADPPAPLPKREGEDPGGTQRTLAWAAIGVGGASFIVGSVSGLMVMFSPCADNAFHAKNKEECSEDAQKRSQNTVTISVISFSLAGGAGIAGLILLLTAPSRTDTPSGKVTPMIGAGFVGLRGSF